MSARVKICGINDPAAFDAAAEAGADWIGFVFFPRSPRHFTPARAAALSARLRGGPKRVGLFVDPAEAEIAAALDAVDLDALQVYGRFPAELAARLGRTFWRAVGITTPADLPRDAGGAQVLVLDAKPPAGATRPGGNAAALEWPILRGWSAPAPWILAGGLTPGNVANAVCQSGATAVDVSSGVETSPGVKSPALIRRFIAVTRAAAG